MSSIKKSNPINIIFPIVILIVSAYILYPVILSELDSGWSRSEFYIASGLNILFFLGLAYYSYKINITNHWTHKFLINFGILLSIGIYYSISIDSDPAVPTLGILTILALIIIIVLTGLHQIANLIRTKEGNNI